MAKIFAFIVGIDNYKSVSPLNGCAADAQAMQALLQKRFSSEELELQVLINAEATRAAIIAGFRKHLARAKQGDTAFFHFSGHGSRESSPVEFHQFFPEKKNETLVCYDSREPGGMDLADKELAVLIQEVAQNQPHIAVSLDCCHSGSGTRNAKLGKKRQAEKDGNNRKIEDYADGYYAQQLKNTGKIEIPAAPHITLSACSNTQVAWETKENRGLFSTVLLDILENESSNLSYGRLFERIQTRIKQIDNSQTPQVDAYGNESVYKTFLRGTANDDRKDEWEVYFSEKKWQIKAGALHGMPLVDREANDRTVKVDILSGKNKVAEAQIDETFIDNTFLMKVENEDKLDPEKTYTATLNAFIPQAVFSFYTDMAKPEALTAGLSVAIARSQAEADYFLVRNADGVYELVHRLSNKIIAAGREPAPYWNELLAKIQRWERLRDIKNPHTEIRDSDLPMRFEFYRNREWESYNINSSEDLEFLLDKDRRGNFLGLPCKIHVKNLHEAELHIALLAVSPLYGIYKLNNVPVPKNEEVLIYDDKNGLNFMQGQEQDSESDLLFKFLISTTRTNPDVLTQDNFSLNVRYKSVGSRFGQQANNAASPFKIEDWTVRNVGVKLLKNEDKISKTQNTKFEGFEVLAHDSVEAQVAFGSVSSSGRGLNDKSTKRWKNWIADDSLQLQSLSSGSSRSTQAKEVISLTNIQGDVSETNPLRLKMNQGLLNEDEIMLPMALDGDTLIPIGISNEEDPSVVEIQNLPETSSSSRSLGRALKFCLYKVSSKLTKMPPTGFFKLCAIDYDEAGKPIYVEDRKEVAARVAKAEKILLFVHGIIGNTSEMAVLGHEFVKAGRYDLIMTFDYENLNTEINEIAYQFKRLLVGDSEVYKDGLQYESIGISADKKVDIVAHSMGGLVSRYMIEQRGGSAFVNRLIMCGTPNAGSVFGKIEQYRKFAILAMGLGANLLAPFGIVLSAAGLIGALKQSKALFVTLEQMGKESEFLRRLNKDEGSEGGIPYLILAGNVQDFVPENPTAMEKIVEKVMAGMGNLVSSNKPNDIAVLVDDIKDCGKNKPVIYDIPCHHMNYFVQDDSVQKLKEIL
ncbi:MAG: caspase family protein [Bernardetiaceae bacterium]|nr:caspase family protein [Bernardetiaceae bacterium]